MRARILAKGALGVLLVGAPSLLVRSRAQAQESTTSPASAETTPIVPATAVTTSTTSDPPISEPPPPCGFVHRPCSYPHMALALEGGVSVLNESGPFGFSTGVGSITSPGPSWGFRVGVELLSWFAIDAHYIGMNNNASSSVSPTGSVGLLTNAATAELRFTIPLRYVQPYLFTGAGVYSTSVTGSDAARAGSPLFGSTELGVPIGLGVGIPITNAISIGAEMTYHRLFGESFAADDEIGGGDITTFNAVVRGRI